MANIEDVDKSDRQEKTAKPNPMTILSDRVDDESADREEYEQLLKLYEGSFRNIAEGEVISGTVLKVSSSDVVVDVGYKSEGMISVQEFLDENGECIVHPGDTVDVLLERTEDQTAILCYRAKRPRR
mgnify:CR=1 FL=1